MRGLLEVGGQPELGCMDGENRVSCILVDRHGIGPVLTVNRLALDSVQERTS